jgi:hypothetical protein
VSCFEVLALAAALAYPVFLLVVAVLGRKEDAPLPRPSQRDLQDRGRRVAAALGGLFHPWGYRGLHVVAFRAAGREAQLWWGRGLTAVMVDLRGVSPGVLLIHPNSGFSGGTGLLGPDLEVGDHAFDAAYVVKARPEELAARLFTVERRPPLISTMLRLRRFRRATFDLGAQSLAVRVGQSLEDVGDLLELCRTAEAFAELVLELSAAGPAIRWGEATESGGGDCQVCGTALEGDVVRCAACRTPHHRDCWTYVGECSTYACRETRFV